MEENFAGGKFREIPFGVDIIFAGGKFRGKSKFANIANISSTRKIGVIQYMPTGVHWRLSDWQRSRVTQSSSMAPLFKANWRVQKWRGYGMV